MMRLSFSHSLVVAVIMTATAGVVYFPVAMVLGNGLAVRVVITLLSAAYGIYLLARSEERSGYLLLAMVWLLAVLATWFIFPKLAVYIAIHLGLMWLTRALYHCSGPIACGFDFVLHVFAYSATLWAAVTTNSIMAATWCLFLTLALFSFIPDASSSNTSGNAHSKDPSGRAFHDALRTARAAAEKLAKA